MHLKSSPLWRIVLALVLMGPLAAIAQDSGGAEAVQSIMRSILSDTSSLISGSPFMAQGKRLLQMLLLILISWKGIQLMLDVSGFNEVVAEIVKIALLWGIASFFLTASVQKQFADGFDDLAKTAATATNSSVDMSRPEAAISNALGRMMYAAMQLYEGSPPDKPASADASAWQQMVSWMSQSWDSLTSGQIFASLASVMFRIFMALAVLITALIYVGQLIVSQIMVNIGLIMAPLFVPWIMWQSTAFLFEGWVSFMIVAGVQKIVGALIFGLTASMIDKVTTLASAANATPAQNFYYYAAAFLIVAIMAYLMLTVSGIALGLVSGKVSVAFRPPAAMTPGGSANRASQGLTKGAAQAYRGAQAGTRGAIGAFQGAKAGTAAGRGGSYTAGRAAGAAINAIKSGGGFLPKSGGKP